MEYQDIYTTERDTEIWRDGLAEVLSVAIEYPLFIASGKGAKRINAYYAQRNKRFMELCKKTMLPKAISCECNQPVEINMHSKVTFADAELVSVLTDVTYSAFSDPMRRADVWYRTGGTPVSAQELFEAGTNVKKLLRSQVAEQIARQTDQYRRFYPDAQKRFPRWLDLGNIYLSSSGSPVLFFPQNTIAPRGEGFVQFNISAPAS